MFTSLLLLMSLQDADAAEKKTVLVFTSDQDPTTTAIVDAYKASTTFAIRRTYDLGSIPNPEEFIHENLDDADPALIFALGDVALEVASRAWPTVPMVYGNVSLASARRAGRNDLISVSGHVDPTLAAKDFATLFPYAHSVSIVRGAGDSDPWWPLLEGALQGAGVDVNVVEAGSVDEIDDAVAGALFRSDVLWIAEDPRLWTAVALRDTFEKARQHDVPVVTWEPRHLAGSAPASVAFRPDTQSIADSAAHVTEQIVRQGIKPDTLATYPSPVLVAGREALLDARVPLSKRTKAVVDEWLEEDSK